MTIYTTFYRETEDIEVSADAVIEKMPDGGGYSVAIHTVLDYFGDLVKPSFDEIEILRELALQTYLNSR